MLGSFERPLIVAAGRNDIAGVAECLRRGAPVNGTDALGRTALHHAAGSGFETVAVLLLRAGANPLILDAHGESALDACQRTGMVGSSGKAETVFGALLAARLRALEAEPRTTTFFYAMLVVQVLFVLLFLAAVSYGPGASGAAPASGNGTALPGAPSSSSDASRFALYQDMHLFVFAGFGLVLAFLHKASYSGLGLSFLVAALAVEWYILAGGVCRTLFTGVGLTVDVSRLVAADFAAAAVLVAWGAMLGKLSPPQAVVATLLCVPAYALNEQIGIYLGAADAGGAIGIHTFGAAFGLACAMFASPSLVTIGHARDKAVYHSDVFALIGTLVLFVFFPSFNAALSAGYSTARNRAVTNSVLALCASAFTGFLLNAQLSPGHRFSMALVQRATLAGGVAIAAVAGAPVQPGGALVIGTAAAFVANYGAAQLGPYLARTLSLHDTAGVLSSHLLPGLLGGLASVFVAGLTSDSSFGSPADLSLVYPRRGSGASASQQAFAQLWWLFMTLIIALLCGGATAFVVRAKALMPPRHEFTDEEFWLTPATETPYYFDCHGPIVLPQVDAAFV